MMTEMKLRNLLRLLIIETLKDDEELDEDPVEEGHEDPSPIAQPNREWDGDGGRRWDNP